MTHDATMYETPWSSQSTDWLLDEARRILDNASVGGVDPAPLIAVAQVHVTAAQVQAIKDLHWTIDTVMRLR